MARPVLEDRPRGPCSGRPVTEWPSTDRLEVRLQLNRLEQLTQGIRTDEMDINTERENPRVPNLSPVQLDPVVTLVFELQPRDENNSRTSGSISK